MAKITWLVGGPSKNVDAWIAHRPEVKAILAAEAKAGGARARAILDSHKPSGGASPHSKITVTKGTRLDWFVNLDDPMGGAGAIEFGRSGGRSSGGATQGVKALAGAF